MNGSEASRADLVAQARLKGIVVLNAAENPPLRLSDFIEAIDRVMGGQRSNADDEGIELLGLQFRLSRAERLWIVIENAEYCFSHSNITPELRSVLDAWCRAAHGVKLIVLSRFELSFPPEYHVGLPAIEAALLDGVPEEAAVTLLRRNFRAPRFQEAQHAVLREIVARLHRMPIAIEAFAGYLNARETYIDALDVKYVRSQDPLRLFQKGQAERFFLQIIKEQIAMLL